MRSRGEPGNDSPHLHLQVHTSTKTTHWRGSRDLRPSGHTLCKRQLPEQPDSWESLLTRLAIRRHLGTCMRLVWGFPHTLRRGTPCVWTICTNHVAYVKTCSPLGSLESVHTWQSTHVTSPQEKPCALVSMTSPSRQHFICVITTRLGRLTSALCDLTGRRLWKLATGFL